MFSTFLLLDNNINLANHLKAGFQAINFSSHLVINCQYKVFIALPLVRTPFKSSLLIIGIFKTSYISAFILFNALSILSLYPKSVDIVPIVACLPSAVISLVASQKAPGFNLNCFIASSSISIPYIIRFIPFLRVSKSSLAILLYIIALSIISATSLSPKASWLKPSLRII